MKECSKCFSWKPLSDFYKSSERHRDGVKNQCKECIRCQTRKRMYTPSPAYAINARRHRATNPESARRAKQKYLAANPEVARAYRVNNRETAAAWSAIHRAAKISATPKWASLSAIKSKYKYAQGLSKTTGEMHHVDHDIPFRGKTVSGLHVENNLVVLPGKENLAKNSFFSDRGWIPGDIWMAGIHQPYSAYPSFVIHKIIRREKHG